MVNEPELQASMRQQLINPLRLAWGLVIFLIVIVIAWAFLSDEDQTTSKIASKNSNIVGADINELAPIKGFNSYNFLVAKLAYKILAYKYLYKN